MVRSAIAATLLASVLFTAGCGDDPDEQRIIGQAFGGPRKFSIHKEISPRSETVAEVQHGEKLDILGRRRRFVKVKTPAGVVGWTHMGQLMAADQMTALDDLAERARELPSHGQATVYEILNVHCDPNRQAPSFYQIREGEHVDVILHEVHPRTAYSAPPIFKPTPKPEPAARKKQKEPEYPPPPAPRPPGLPQNWLEMSKTVLPPELQPPPPKPVPLDDWTLVRLKNGRAGWVLTRMLRMSIPDDVAQYSEGHRITSYFPMIKVQDGDQVRHHWLWTTLSREKQPYQFDSFRWFIWNVKRHRYETAYIERNVKGYFPVRVHEVRDGPKNETFPGFTLILEEPDGTRSEKTYAYKYYRVVLVDKRAYQPPASAHSEDDEPATAEPEGDSGWLTQIKRLKQKWFGR